MEDETINSCSDFGPKYEFCPDADWWKEGISYSDVIDQIGLSKAPSRLEQEFNERADRWEREARIHSAPGAAILHRDYQSIIGMGQPAIPLILKRLKTSGGNWFWALRHISRVEEDPARDAKDIESAVEVWLEWGRKMRYIE
jgi:hypothetical protein